MNPRDRGRIVKFLVTKARKEILREFNPDSCIASTRICIELLSRLSIAAQPLKVTVSIFNAAMKERIKALDRYPTESEALAWIQEGCWSIGVGYGKPMPGKWPGHLVCVVERKLILDVSIDQANRPERGIILRPLAVLIPEPASEFVDKGSPLTFEANDMLFSYQSDPKDRSFEQTPDWRKRKRIRRVAQRLVRKLPF